MTGQVELELMELELMEDLRCSQGECRPPEGLAQLQGSRPQGIPLARGVQQQQYQRRQARQESRGCSGPEAVRELESRGCSGPEAVREPQTGVREPQTAPIQVVDPRMVAGARGEPC